MKAVKRAQGAEDVVVLVSGPDGGLNECIVRPTRDTVTLGEQVYHRYQIIKPHGYEREEILQPLGQGTAGLLGTVFATLAHGGSRGWRKTAYRGE